MHGHTRVCKQLLVDLGPPDWGVPLSGSLPTAWAWLSWFGGPQSQGAVCGMWYMGMGQGWPRSVSQARHCGHGEVQHGMARHGTA